MHLPAEALGSEGPHLDSRTHYLGGLSCRYRCLLLHLGLHLLHLGLHLRLLHHHRRSDLRKGECSLEPPRVEGRAPTTSVEALNLEAFCKKEDGIDQGWVNDSYHQFGPKFLPLSGSKGKRQKSYFRAAIFGSLPKALKRDEGQ